MRLGIEFCPNKEYCNFHLEVRVPRISTYGGDGQNHVLKSRLSEIQGLTDDVFSHNYCVRVQRAGVYTWEELIPQVKKVLSSYFNSGEEFEEVEIYPQYKLGRQKIES